MTTTAEKVVADSGEGGSGEEEGSWAGDWNRCCRAGRAWSVPRRGNVPAAPAAARIRPVAVRHTFRPAPAALSEARDAVVQIAVGADRRESLPDALSLRALKRWKSWRIRFGPTAWSSRWWCVPAPMGVIC